MNREDIIRMAEEAEFHVSGHRVLSPVIEGTDLLWLLERFAALVAAAAQEKMMDRIRNIIVEAEERGAATDREACAQLVESLEGYAQYFPHVPDAIRSRGNT